MAYEFGGKVALVTGASSGIGRQVAIDLASRGSTTVVLARRAELLEEVATACRRSAPSSEAITADVGDRAQVEGAVADVIARHRRLDILINNAAIPMRVHASRLSSEQVERTMRINFLGAAYATLAALPSMLERGSGEIVNVASVAGRVGSPREAAYTASKFALAGWSEVLAADLAGTGVRTHLVVPGPIDTDIWSKVDEPAAYRGKLYPPSVVSEAILRCITGGRFERWAPKRLRFVTLAHAVAREQFVKGLARYDRRAPKA